MPSIERSEVWLVDLGLAAKARPAVVVSIPFLDNERAVYAIVPHTTARRGGRFEVVIPVPWLEPGAFDVQGIRHLPRPVFLRRLGDLTPAQPEAEPTVQGVGGIAGSGSRRSWFDIEAGAAGSCHCFAAAHCIEGEQATGLPRRDAGEPPGRQGPQAGQPAYAGPTPRSPGPRDGDDLRRQPAQGNSSHWTLISSSTWIRRRRRSARSSPGVWVRLSLFPPTS